METIKSNIEFEPMEELKEAPREDDDREDPFDSDDSDDSDDLAPASKGQSPMQSTQKANQLIQ